MKSMKNNNYILPEHFARLLAAVMIVASVMALAAPQPVYASSQALFTCTVKVESGYLALRTEKEYNKKNEIGKLYTGDVVIECPTDEVEGEYIYVYSPKLRRHGYVNADYIYYSGFYDGRCMYAEVESGYLALRNAKAFQRKNEIGKLNTGDVVIVLDDSDIEYWTVYAPSLCMTGYVNRNYLVDSIRAEGSSTKPVVFSEDGYCEWRKTADGRFEMHVQVKNNTGNKTINSFSLEYWAMDEDGVFIGGVCWLYEDTTYRQISPGTKDFSNVFSFPNADRVRKVCVLIKSVSFTDGTQVEYPLDACPYAEWEF